VRALVAFAVADARSLGRDPLLRSMLIAPIGLMGLLTVGVPLVEGWLAASYGLDLTPHRPVLVAFLTALVLPLFFGSLAGLLLLEDRGAGVLPAIAVSPAGLRSYLVVRLLWAGGAAAVAVAGALLIDGGVPSHVAGITAVLSGGFAATLALLLGGLATDRLEGMAVAKAAMLPLSAVLLVTVVDAPWSWPLGSLPSYAPVVAVLDGMGGRPVWPVAGFGLVQHGAWIWLLARRVASRIG
jgi:fluoroquinolone transport system permease protein